MQQQHPIQPAQITAPTYTPQPAGAVTAPAQLNYQQPLNGTDQTGVAQPIQQQPQQQQQPPMNPQQQQYQGGYQQQRRPNNTYQQNGGDRFQPGGVTKRIQKGPFRGGQQQGGRGGGRFGGQQGRGPPSFGGQGRRMGGGPGPGPGPMRQPKDQSMFKTQLCPQFQQGTCTQGMKCHFAHGEHELRHKPDLRKTKLCINFGKGKCIQGEGCQYAHGQEDLRQMPGDSGFVHQQYQPYQGQYQGGPQGGKPPGLGKKPPTKFKLCQNFMNGGNCRNGANCGYAHGQQEIGQVNTDAGQQPGQNINQPQAYQAQMPVQQSYIPPAQVQQPLNNQM